MKDPSCWVCWSYATCSNGHITRCPDHEGEPLERSARNVDPATSTRAQRTWRRRREEWAKDEAGIVPPVKAGAR